MEPATELSWDWGEEEEGEGMAEKGAELVGRSGSKTGVKGEVLGAAHVPPAPRGNAEQILPLCWDSLGQGSRHKLQAGAW